MNNDKEKNNYLDEDTDRFKAFPAYDLEEGEISIRLKKIINGTPICIDTVVELDENPTVIFNKMMNSINSYESELKIATEDFIKKIKEYRENGNKG